jgi:hypothetical protein
VRSAAEPVARRRSHRIDTVHDLGDRAVVHAPVILGRPRIAVPTGLAQRRAGVEVPRRADQPFLNGEREAGITSGDVSDGGEAAPQCPLQPHRGGQGDVTHRSELQAPHVQADAIGVEVRVDQTRDDGAAVSIQHWPAGPGFLGHHISSHRLDDAVGHVDRSISQFSRDAVEDPDIRDDEAAHSALSSSSL